MTFKARGRLLNNRFLVLAESGSGHAIVMDEPSALGGSNLGPNPVETLLAALAGCALVVVSEFASSVGVEVTEASAEVEGTLDINGFRGRPGIRAGLQKINLKVVVKSPSADERISKLKELIESRCPVDDTLKHGTNVNLEVIKST
jgi:uncharacterized OsmC-like protein